MKSYAVFEILKIEIKSEECAQEISSCFICFTLVIINCGKSVILKGKQVSLEKRFSDKFFHCFQSLPPASTCSCLLFVSDAAMTSDRTIKSSQYGVVIFSRDNKVNSQTMLN